MEFNVSLKENAEKAKKLGDKFQVKYWHSPQDRELGESEIESSDLSFEEAYELFNKIKHLHTSVELQVCGSEDVILYHGLNVTGTAIIEEWQI